MPSPFLTPIRQTHCTACGYPLTGLQTIGRCPECGAPYDDSTLILFGWAPARFNTSQSARIWYIAAICFSIFFWCDGLMGAAGTLMLVSFGKWHDAGFATLLTAGYGAAGAGLFWLARRLRNPVGRLKTNPELLGTPTIQLHLTPEGYSARRGFGPRPSLLHWNCDLEIDLTYTSGIARLRIARLSPVGTFDWSSVVDLAFPATSQQVDSLRACIEVLRDRLGAE